MRRRELVGVMCSLPIDIMLGPLTAFAQRPGQLRRIGTLLSGAASDAEIQRRFLALRKELQALNWIEGQNYSFEHRWPSNNPDLIKRHAAELVGLAPDIIIVGIGLGVAALKSETSSVPIVFVNIADPVGGGLIPSLARTRSNVTGFTAFEYVTAGKWIELLKELSPATKRVAFVHGGPEFGGTGEGFRKILEAAAPVFQIELVPIRVKTSSGLQRDIEEFATKPNGGLIAAADAGTSNNRALIVEAAEQYRLPAVYPFRYWATSGGLAVYGIDVVDQYRRAATYVDRILRGTNPDQLPVQAPNKFELIINLRAAASIGLQVDPLLLARADEVIE